MGLGGYDGGGRLVGGCVVITEIKRVGNESASKKQVKNHHLKRSTPKTHYEATHFKRTTIRCGVGLDDDSIRTATAAFLEDPTSAEVKWGKIQGGLGLWLEGGGCGLGMIGGGGGEGGES